MSDASTLYCARCRRAVQPVCPWPGFRWVKRAWYAGLLLLVLLMPVILSEITLLLPLAMAFALAAGPVHRLAGEPCSCSECGAEIVSK